jgi:hypothetical protein
MLVSHLHAHGVSISGKMTVGEGQQHIVDPEASLRAELTGATAAAQIDIANAIAELARIGADSSALSNQGQALQQLQRTVGKANLGSLLALRSEVATATTSATALANQAIATATNAAAANATQTPAQRARASIEALQRDLFENRALDPYLQFKSAEDEEAYRKRERERKEATDRAMELRTPEGDRRAAELQHDQLRDAGAHGADRSPDYAGMVQRANTAMADLPPPRQATEQSAPNSGAQPVQEGRPSPSDDGLGDILATLKAAGVTTPAAQASDAGHGVRRSVAQAPDVACAIRQG